MVFHFPRDSWMCSKCISIATYTVAGSRSVKFFVVTQGVKPSLEHLLGQRQLSKAAMLLRGNFVKLTPIIPYPWRVMIPHMSIHTYVYLDIVAGVGSCMYSFMLPYYFGFVFCFFCSCLSALQMAGTENMSAFVSNWICNWQTRGSFSCIEFI